ncbi:Leucine-rich repeat [Trema orientale]|uniref:Leucine-rich repeat n=1 Tax=Trema orientale TaxID=63057 RepID=A0A2P5EZT4_TREOI|nr:Leucine-rich repeat [Trema orientale]
MDKVLSWRNALKKVADLAGWNSHDISLQYFLNAHHAQSKTNGNQPQGTINVEGLFLNTGEVREMHLNPTVFLKMYNLRLPKIYGKYDTGYVWCAVFPHNLVQLDMPNSQVEQLWNGVQDLTNLRSINLSGSVQLTQIPDLSRASNIEVANFGDCKNLLQVPSFQHLEKLSELRLYGCSSLDKFPLLPRNIKWLSLGFTAIEQVHSSEIDSLSSLEHFELNDCIRLKCLPSSIMLKSVTTFNLSGCTKLKKFPEISEPMEYLTMLSLDRIGVKELPSSIENLIKLTRLHLCDCQDLESLPNSIRNLNSLTELLIYFCTKLVYIPQLPSSVRYLDAKCCTSLKMVSSSMTSFERDWYERSCQEQLVFKDCLKLDHEARNNIMVDAQFRILRMAIVSSKYGLESYFDSRSEICWPTDEIPAWFSYQSEGSSLSIEISHDCLSNNFLGVALCTIVDFEDDHSDYYEFCCKSSFITADGRDTMFWQHFWYGNFWYHLPGRDRNIVIMKSNHAFLVHSGSSFIEFLKAKEEEYGINNWHCSTTTSFHFSMLVENGQPAKGIKVKKCGVHFLYAQDAEKFRINVSQNPKSSKFFPLGNV